MRRRNSPRASETFSASFHTENTHDDHTDHQSGPMARVKVDRGSRKQLPSVAQQSEDELHRFCVLKKSPGPPTNPSRLARGAPWKRLAHRTGHPCLGPVKASRIQRTVGRRSSKSAELARPTPRGTSLATGPARIARNSRQLGESGADNPMACQLRSKPGLPGAGNRLQARTRLFSIVSAGITHNQASAAGSGLPGVKRPCGGGRRSYNSEPAQQMGP